MVIFDFGVEVYHRICFPLYGIPLVKRGQYIRIDRYKMSYLPLFDKVNCAYCGYANGLTRYSAEIAAQSEKYWCGIKNKPKEGFKEPWHHASFIPYGDKQAFSNFISKTDQK